MLGKYFDKYVHIKENVRVYAGNVERKGTTKGTVNLKLLTKERDLMRLLLWR